MPKPKKNIERFIGVKQSKCARTGRRLAYKVSARNGEAIVRTRFAQKSKGSSMTAMSHIAKKHRLGLCASVFDSSCEARNKKQALTSVTRTGRRLACKVSARNGEAIVRTRFAQKSKGSSMTALSHIAKKHRLGFCASGFDSSCKARTKKQALTSECLFFVGDAYGNRTHVTAVKGPCLNRLTNAPTYGSGSRI